MIASLKLAMYALALISFDLMDLHTSIPQLRRSAKTAVFRPRVAAMWPLADVGLNSGERGRIPCRSTAAWLLSQGYEPMSGQFLIYF